MCAEWDAKQSRDPKTAERREETLSPLCIWRVLGVGGGHTETRPPVLLVVWPVDRIVSYSRSKEFHRPSIDRERQCETHRYVSTTDRQYHALHDPHQYRKRQAQDSPLQNDELRSSYAILTSDVT